MGNRRYNDYDDYDQEEYHEESRSFLETLLLGILILPLALVVWTISIPFVGLNMSLNAHVLGLYRDRLHPDYPRHRN